VASPATVTVLVVDDDEALRRSTARILGSASYRALEAGDGAEAKHALDTDPTIAAVLCDVRMPGQSGLELLVDIAADFPDVAVVMMTGVDAPDVADAAFDSGAFGYVVKPFEKNELLINLSSALRRRDLELARREHVEGLERAVTRGRSVGKLVDDLAFPLGGDTDDVIERLSRAISLRDEETGRHLERMSRYSSIVAESVGLATLSVEEVRLATALHDIGKIGVADSILLKPGSLTDGEYSAMQKHAQIGYQLLAGSSSHLLETAADIALAHHEWWDGGGYPRGLRGDEIPEVARLAGVTDVFDALTSHRVYRPAMTFEAATTLMTGLRGRQFDPRIFDAFLEAIDDIADVRAQFEDEHGSDGTIRVMVVDDHEIFVASLVRLLSTKPNVKIVATAGTVADATTAITEYRPEIVLMDFELPDGDGAAATERIKALVPAAKVIMLTARTDDSALARAIAAGCAGFVRKHDAIDELFGAIDAVHEGDTTASVRDVLPLIDRLAPTHRRVGRDLRPREREVLELAASGLSNKEIAQQLSVTLNTIRNHMQSVLYKLDSHSKLEAVATAVREGIIARV
jgi:putative two-component system response regulator